MKYYVVWVGRKPGIYDNWLEAFAQVNRFKGARHKSYGSKAEAIAAYETKPIQNYRMARKPTKEQSATIREMQVILDRLIVNLKIYRMRHPRR